jgi:hypothetical protein
MNASKQASKRAGSSKRELLQQRNIKPAKNPKTKKYKSASLLPSCSSKSLSFLFIQVSFYSTKVAEQNGMIFVELHRQTRRKRNRYAFGPGVFLGILLCSLSWQSSI